MCLKTAANSIPLDLQFIFHWETRDSSLNHAKNRRGLTQSWYGRKIFALRAQLDIHPHTFNAFPRPLGLEQ